MTELPHGYKCFRGTYTPPDPELKAAYRRAMALLAYVTRYQMLS